MAKLKQSTEVINLGKKIVEEFSADERADTTTRWMSHYLAELILEVEDEKNGVKKKKLQKDCETIILDIWSKREYFPDGSTPLSQLKGVISILESLSEDDGRAPWDRLAHYRESSSPWSRFMKKLAEDFRTMTDLILCTAASMHILAKGKEWLKFEKFLSEDEKAILKHIDRLLARDSGPFRIVYITSDPSAIDNKEEPQTKLEEIFSKMEEILSSQNKELNSLKESALNIQHFTKTQSSRKKKPSKKEL